MMYIASIGKGDYDDYREEDIFCSKDKDKVKKWVNKFNRIIKDNEERISKYNYKSDKVPFWYGFIKWEYPTAFIKEVPIR